jgi:hypothetical protein
MQFVKVEFLINGVVDENLIRTGVLFDDMVLVESIYGIGLYDALPSQLGEPDVVLVDLDLYI